MSLSTVIVDLLEANIEMLKWHLSDFSDAEMFVRPCPGANHAAWQVGQFTAAEVNLIAVVAEGVHSPQPEGFAAHFTKETASIDDPAKFPSKQELLGQFEKTRRETIKWVKTLSDEQLLKATPEKWHRFAKTTGDMALMQGMHVTMHIGQIQVIRRKLGKPVLF
jgi:hypothetical protein